MSEAHAYIYGVNTQSFVVERNRCRRQWPSFRLLTLVTFNDSPEQQVSGFRDKQCKPIPAMVQPSIQKNTSRIRVAISNLTSFHDTNLHNAPECSSLNSLLLMLKKNERKSRSRPLLSIPFSPLFNRPPRPIFTSLKSRTNTRRIFAIEQAVFLCTDRGIQKRQNSQKQRTPNLSAQANDEDNDDVENCNEAASHVSYAIASAR